MSELLKRIKKQSLHAKIMQVEDTLQFFKDGMNIGFQGLLGMSQKLCLDSLRTMLKRIIFKGNSALAFLLEPLMAVIWTTLWLH